MIDKVVIEGILNYTDAAGMSVGIFDIDNESLHSIIMGEFTPVFEIVKAEPFLMRQEWGKVRITIEILDASARLFPEDTGPA